MQTHLRRPSRERQTTRSTVPLRVSGENEKPSSGQPHPSTTDVVERKTVNQKDNETKDDDMEAALVHLGRL